MKQKATFYIDSEALENFRFAADDGNKKYSELVERMIKAYNEGIKEDFNLGLFCFAFRHDEDLLEEIVRIMEEELERGYTKTKKVRHINLRDEATIDGTILIRWNTEALNNIITFFKAIAYE